MYKLFLKKHAVRPRSRNVSSNIVRWICDLRAWLEDILFTGNVSLYDHTQFFSNGHRTSPPPPCPKCRSSRNGGNVDVPSSLRCISLGWVK